MSTVPVLTCPGSVSSVSTEDGYQPYCSSGWQVEEVQSSTPITAIEPAELLEYFSLGFGVVVMFWALGKSVSLVLSMIRR